MKQKPINWYMYMKYESFFRNYKIASLSIDQFILSWDFDLFRILYYANISWCTYDLYNMLNLHNLKILRKRSYIEPWIITVIQIKLNFMIYEVQEYIHIYILKRVYRLKKRRDFNCVETNIITIQTTRALKSVHILSSC